MMKTLIIGGTGLISVGIVNHLLARGAEVTMFNRGERERSGVPAKVEVLHGDRNDEAAFAHACGARAWDVVIDMICFEPKQAEADVRIFGGKCEQFIFCSTVCTYGTKVPPHIFVDEKFPQEPISTYGRNKVLCEKIFQRAHDEKKFQMTTIRPSHTYGPGASLIDNLEGDPVAWDRIERGLPVLCAGDGLGLWVSTHRNDCGKLFAYGALNPKTYGRSYNATHEVHLTWEQYFRTVAEVLGKPVKLLYLPAEKIWKREPNRFGLLREITAFHGAYDSSKARRDVPEFTCEISFAAGAAETLEDVRRRKKWKTSEGDAVYEELVVAARG
jgi:nucleoside-diphosphate-sugar epimerase